MSEKRVMIKTRRLILQPFTEADQDAMEQLLCNEKIKETFMLPDFTSADEVARLFDKFMEWSQDDSRYERGIYLEHKLIGFVNTVEIVEDTIELGYVIHPDYHSCGYASEALRAVIADLFAKGYHTVCGGAFQENIASCRVMEACGMKRISRTADVEYRGSVHPCVYYAIKQ